MEIRIRKEWDIADCNKHSRRWEMTAGVLKLKAYKAMLLKAISKRLRQSETNTVRIPNNHINRHV